MSTWRRRFSRRHFRSNENDEILLNNTMKYRKKLQAAIAQIHRTKKFAQRNLENSDAEIHVARLINDIGQLSDCKSLQEITSLIDSLAMRHQLSSRIFNEYAMNGLQETLEKLNDDLAKDFDQTKSVLEQAKTNHCSDHTQRKLSSKIQTEWTKHQNLARREFKRSLTSFCQIGSFNLKIQQTLLEKLQNFVDQIPTSENIDDEQIDRGLENFSTNSLETRREIDTMLRVMLDSVANQTSSPSDAKRPKFLTNHLTLSHTLYSPEVSEAAAAVATIRTPQRQDECETRLINTDSLPSYTDLFVVPSNCKN